VLWVKSNTHFARCGSYRTGEVPLGDSISEADKQRQTTNRAYQFKLVVYTNSDDGPRRRLHFALLGKVRLQSNRR